MSQDEAPILNPNSATEEELRQLPGVGPQLAVRIVEGRPYRSLEDMRKVTGLGESVLKDIEPMLTFQSPKAEPKVEEPRTPTEDREAAKKQQYPLAIAEPRGRDYSFWALLATGAASILCSVSLTLAVLAGINGTLDFSRSSALQDTQNELLQIQSQVETIQVELEALRARAEALEGVSGRMTEVERQVAGLQEQIGETSRSMDTMQTEIAAALEETRAQAQRVNRFQTFLDGLSRLIGQITSEP